MSKSLNADINMICLSPKGGQNIPITNFYYLCDQRRLISNIVHVIMILNLLILLSLGRAEEFIVCNATGVEHQNGIDYMTFNVRSQGIKDAVLLGNNTPDFRQGDANHMALSSQHISRDKGGEIIKVMCPQNMPNFNYKYYAVAFYDKDGGSVTSIPFQNGGAGNVNMVPLSGNMTSTTNATGMGMEASQYNGYASDGKAAGSGNEAMAIAADGSSKRDDENQEDGEKGDNKEGDQEDNGVSCMTIYSALGLFAVAFLAL